MQSKFASKFSFITLNFACKDCKVFIGTSCIQLGMTNTSPTLYCICWVTVLGMSKRLKSAIAVFVFEQLDFIFLYVSEIHARRTTCKDYVMICFSILYKTSLVIAYILLYHQPHDLRRLLRAYDWKVFIPNQKLVARALRYLLLQRVTYNPKEVKHTLLLMDC